MLENPRSTVGKPISALGPSDSSFVPLSLAPVGMHHLLLSDLTTALNAGIQKHPIAQCRTP